MSKSPQFSSLAEQFDSVVGAKSDATKEVAQEGGADISIFKIPEDLSPIVESPVVVVSGAPEQPKVSVHPADKFKNGFVSVCSFFGRAKGHAKKTVDTVVDLVKSYPVTGTVFFACMGLGTYWIAGFALSALIAWSISNWLFLVPTAIKAMYIALKVCLLASFLWIGKKVGKLENGPKAI